MKNYSILLILILSIFSCKQKTNLQKEFLCETKGTLNTEEIIDFKNKFSITVPKTWKTQLYYDTIQTQIMTADTTKNFTNTYTLIFEYNSGNLKIDTNFLEDELEKLQKNKLLVLKNKKDNFKKKPCIWFVTKGKKLKYDYYYFEMFVKQNNNHYFKISVDIYGDENIDERFCEAIFYIETLNFLD